MRGKLTRLVNSLIAIRKRGSLHTSPWVRYSGQSDGGVLIVHSHWYEGSIEGRVGFFEDLFQAT